VSGWGQSVQNSRFLELFATFFYLGRAPYFKGTVGTLGALPLVLAFSYGGIYIYVALTFALALAGWAICDAYELYTQNHDSPEVVIDEVVGFLVAMLWMPFTWQAFLYGFLIFRFLDILKPPPISWIDQRVRGGYGVMLDDLAAGVITNLILQFMYTQTDWLGIQWVG
jgi:phosphatidylglycerophosphatase A